MKKKARITIGIVLLGILIGISPSSRIPLSDEWKEQPAREWWYYRFRAHDLIGTWESSGGIITNRENNWREQSDRRKLIKENSKLKTTFTITITPQSGTFRIPTGAPLRKLENGDFSDSDTFSVPIKYSTSQKKDTRILMIFIYPFLFLLACLYLLSPPETAEESKKEVI